MFIYAVRVSRCSNENLEWRAGTFVYETKSEWLGVPVYEVCAPHKATFYPSEFAARNAIKHGPGDRFVGVAFEVVRFKMQEPT